ncbi:hypothetical protein P5658_26660 [Bacillus subtilis]|uniref:Uncharacterized protein n=1 Tax=Bacillus subtilis TaxID=1423 RepID=A0AC62A020_BACIU
MNHTDNPIISAVISKLNAQQEKGLAKYGAVQVNACAAGCSMRRKKRLIMQSIWKQLSKRSKRLTTIKLLNKLSKDSMKWRLRVKTSNAYILPGIIAGGIMQCHILKKFLYRLNY